MERAALAAVARALAAYRNIVCILDCSDAMAGGALGHAKAICRGLIDALQDSRRFTLVAFGSGVLAFDDCLHVADEPTKALAGDFLELLEPLGGHALHHAMERALACRQGNVDAVVCVGEGRGLPLHGIQRLARERAVAIHAVDFAPPGSSSLLPLCAATGGIRVSLEKPEGENPPSQSEPLRYFCYQGILFRRARVLPEWHPGRVIELLNALARAEGDGSLPAELAGEVAALERGGYGRRRILAVLSLVMNDLAAIGGTGWLRQPASPGAAGRGSLYLHLRVRMMALCRDWCRQEVRDNPSFGLEAVPGFLVKVDRGRQR